MSRAPDNSVQDEQRRDAAQTDLADLTNIVLHEFNNALNNVSLNLAVMEQKGVPAQLEPELNAIRRAVSVMGMKAQRLQGLCQPERPSLQPTDLNRIVTKIVETWQRRHPDLDLQLVRASRLARVQATPVDLQRILGLLLEDATAALKGRPARITVSTSVAAAGDIELRVTDTGPPLPPEEEAFEPFAPGRASGDNLRLALCKELTKRLQGSIRAENQPEGGVAVTVCFQRAT